MKRIKNAFLIPAIMCIPFFSISQHASVDSGPGTITDIIAENARGYYSQVMGFQVNSISCEGLYETVADWLGTPYVYSGKSSRGIDCSGFVTMLYNKVYNNPLTGNAAELYQKVAHIKMKDLREGDLVFFRIRQSRISHVGVYLGDNKFAHASRTNGVIISDLSSPYYKKYFVKGGKVKSDF